MQIHDLKDHPHHLHTLADWHHAEWSYLNPARSLQERIEEMREDLLGRVVPTTFVAVEAAELLGSASLLADDMSTHPDYSPWLASVFVAPAHRGQGIGSVLIRRVMQHARDNGIKRLYLYTPDQAKLYAGLGWHTVSEEPYNGTPVTIMAIDFA